MKGKVCLITGATRGLGQAAALGLARQGAQVVIVGRSRERIDSTLSAIRAEAPGACVEALQGDLASQADVRRVAAEFSARYDALDVLINNVGATLLKYQSSPDGIEMTWALNYLNHFLLTNLLKNSLKAAVKARGEARVLEITSSIYRISNPSFQRLQQQKGYNGVLAYAQSKRAMIVLAYDWARRMQNSGIAMNAITPGFVLTNIAGGNNLLWAKALMVLVKMVSMPVEEGVKPILHLASAPEMKGKTGGYYKRFAAQPHDASCARPEVAERLWKISQDMTKIRR